MSKYLMIQGSGSSFATNAIEQVQIAGSEVVIAPLSDVTGMYVKEDTGVVTANNYQAGYLYQVEEGDIINVYCTVDGGNAVWLRYGVFASSNVSVGDTTTNYGVIKESPGNLVVTSSGYLMVTCVTDLQATIIVKKVLQ